MEPTNQTNLDKQAIEDKDFEALKAKIPFDADDTKKEEKPTVTPPKEEEKKDIKPPVIDIAVKGEEKIETPPPRAPRPEKYIPLDKYIDEKKEWKSSEESKDKRIAELETIAGLNDQTKKFDSAVKKYAEKHGVDEETAKLEVEKVRDILDFTSPPVVKPTEKKSDVPTLSDEQRRSLQEADQIRAEKAFNVEYDTVAIPQLKTLFPNATLAQLNDAKADLEKLACTEKYLDKSLDYIAFKEKAALSDIFSTERKGPESSKPTQKGKETLTPKDFNENKTSFKELQSLSIEERDNIVKAFDDKTWDKYMNWISQNEELEVS